MRVLFVAIVASFIFQATAYAKPRGRYYPSNSNQYYSMPSVSTQQSMPSVQQSYTVGGGGNSTAQGVAEMMAQRGYVGHFGGNSGYEGCGSGFSPDQAYRNCCYSNSGMTTVDVGYAQGRDGRWYCCRRYR